MEPPTPRVATPPPRPLMVWDGDCRFCGAWIRRWKDATGDAVDYEPYQSVGDRFPEIKAADYAREIHLIFPDGRVTRGAEAVFAALNTRPGGGMGLRLYQRAPAFAKISEWCYRRVANNRTFLSLLTQDFLGRPRRAQHLSLQRDAVSAAAGAGVSGGVRVVLGPGGRAGRRPWHHSAENVFRLDQPRPAFQIFRNFWTRRRCSGSRRTARA